MTPTPPTPAEPEEDLKQYVGLDRAVAEKQARASGWTTVRSLAPDQPIEWGYQIGRINFEVKDDAVTICWKG